MSRMIGFGIALVVGMIILCLYIELYIPFKNTREYIQMEINRSYTQEEYEYWKSEMKKLYLKSIPIIRWIIK